jgi:hypothetical protein
MISTEIRTAAAIVLGYLNFHPLCDECDFDQTVADFLNSLIRGERPGCRREDTSGQLTLFDFLQDEHGWPMGTAPSWLDDDEAQSDPSGEVGGQLELPLVWPSAETPA